MIWLGEQRGHLSDWATQLWVKATGRSVSLDEHPWLEGPVGRTTGIGADYFIKLANERGLTLVDSGPPRGLLPDFDVLRAADFDPDKVARSVVDFYTTTSSYELDAWAEWTAPFRPFGWLLALIFSRRLQQLNIPLSGLDTAGGMTSDVLQLVDPGTGGVVLTAWLRTLIRTGHVLYAGTYEPCQLPGRDGQCLKVVFPLPNGNAMVIMHPVAHADGSLTVVSAGDGFGEPGFYFTIRRADDTVWVRYVRSLRESIHVYPSTDVGVRADHNLTLFGMAFLRLHYRLRPALANAEIEQQPN